MSKVQVKVGHNTCVNLHEFFYFMVIIDGSEQTIHQADGQFLTKADINFAKKCIAKSLQVKQSDIEFVFETFVMIR